MPRSASATRAFDGSQPERPDQDDRLGAKLDPDLPSDQKAAVDSVRPTPTGSAPPMPKPTASLPFRAGLLVASRTIRRGR